MGNNLFPFYNRRKETFKDPEASHRPEEVVEKLYQELKIARNDYYQIITNRIKKEVFNQFYPGDEEGEVE